MYDREIATFAARLSAEGGPLAASVDDLAAEKEGGGGDPATTESASDDAGDGEEVVGGDVGQRRIEDEL